MRRNILPVVLCYDLLKQCEADPLNPHPTFYGPLQRACQDINWRSNRFRSNWCLLQEIFQQVVCEELIRMLQMWESHSCCSALYSNSSFRTDYCRNSSNSGGNTQTHTLLTTRKYRNGRNNGKHWTGEKSEISTNFDPESRMDLIIKGKIWTSIPSLVYA